MKLGVNSDVNADGTMEVSTRHNLGVNKVKLSHVVQNYASHVVRKAADKIESLDNPKIEKNTHTQHELNLTLVMIAATATAWLLFRRDVCEMYLLPVAGNKMNSWIRIVNSSP